MFTLGLFFLMSAAFAYGSWKVWLRLPEATQNLIKRAIRRTRRMLGSYDVKDVVESMVESTLDSAIPSISTRYLPSVVEFGFHPHHSRWSRGYSHV